MDQKKEYNTSKFKAVSKYNNNPAEIVRYLASYYAERQLT